MTLVRTEKTKDRKHRMAIRDRIPAEERENGAELICQALREDPAYATCDLLLAYVAIRSELSLQRVIEDALASGKAVYLPRTTGRVMEFYRIRSMEDLVPGDFGIPVPAGDEPPDFSEGSQPLMLLPGVAYDRKGNRMGYGGGYYDRYLETHPELIPHTIGVGFRQQLTEALPVEDHDVRPARLLLV